MLGFAAYLTFGLIGPSIPLLILAFTLAGVTIGIVETAEHGTVAEAAPDDIRGSAFGFLAALLRSDANQKWTLNRRVARFAWSAEPPDSGS